VQVLRALGRLAPGVRVPVLRAPRVRVPVCAAQAHGDARRGSSRRRAAVTSAIYTPRRELQVK